MAYIEYFDTLRKRIANGLSVPTHTGKARLDENIRMVLELHRLLPICPLCSLSYVIRVLISNLTAKSPDKGRMAAITEFYSQMLVIMGDYRWPAPDIAKSLHDKIRTKLQQANELVQKAIDCHPLNADERKMLRTTASKEAKKAIKNAEAVAKQETAEKKRQQEVQKQAEDLRMLLNKGRELSLAIRQSGQTAICREYVHKIKNPGYKPVERDSEAVRNTIIEKECILHEVYHEKYGHYVSDIPCEIRESLMPLVEERIQQRRKEQQHEATAQQQKAIADNQMTCVTHKVRLAPNNMQKAYLQKCFGIVRFCYNWCYDRWMEARSSGNRVFPSELSKAFTDIGRKQYPFAYEVSHFARVSGFDAFESAIQSLFDGKGFPQRKRRNLGGSFAYTVTSRRKQPMLCDYNPDIPGSKPSKKRQYLLIPTFGYIKMQEHLRFRGLLKKVVIKQEADGRYYACLNVYVTPGEWRNTHTITGQTVAEPVGIDLGLSALATLSNGLKIDGHKDNQRLYAEQKRLQWHIEQKRKAHPGHTSKNKKRLSVELGKVKGRLRHSRTDYLHKLTSALAYTYRNIVVENLNVTAMLHDVDALSAQILHSSFYQLRILLEQKMQMAGHTLTVADKFMPTTRTCSRCGHLEPEKPLRDRTYRCPVCGLEIDRDLNAAVNLTRHIGLGEPDSLAADKGRLTALLTRSGITTHQAEGESRLGT